MTLEEHTNLIREIRENAGDEGKLSVSLAKLSEDYGATLKTATELTAERDKLKTDNESLRSANMDLFLKVGSQVQQNNSTQQNTNQQQNNQQETTLSFDALFDDKGNLK